MIKITILILAVLICYPIITFSQCNTSYNVALGRPATASSIENGGTPASNAFDGNMTSRWSSLFTDNQYIYVDLGISYPICQVVLYWENALGKNFTIDISNDAVTWTTVMTVTGNTSFTNILSVSGTGRYIRMNGTLRGTGFGYSLYEFQVYSSNATPLCPTTNIALGKTATASSIESVAFPASNAVDGNTGTRWSSAFSDPQYIYVNLGASYNLCSVGLNWEAAYGKDFTIDASNDGLSWTNLSTITGNTSLINNITISGSGQYVRMLGTARGTGFGYSLYEFSITGSALLPVSLTGFKAVVQTSGSVMLEWNTEGEVNNKSFEIERSAGGQPFLAIGSVEGHGNISIEEKYSFIDENPVSGINYYRLKQTDFDGHFSYSEILTADLSGTNNLLIQAFPNPVMNLLTIRSKDQDPIESLLIYNQSGVLLIQMTPVSSSLFTLPVQQLIAGIYFVQVTTRHNKQTFRVLKQ